MPTPSRTTTRKNKSFKPTLSSIPEHTISAVPAKHVTAKNVANSMKRFNAILKARPAHYKVVKGGRKTRRNRRA